MSRLLVSFLVSILTTPPFSVVQVLIELEKAQRGSGGAKSSEEAIALQVHRESARLLWSNYGFKQRPEPRGGVSYLELWVENIDSSDAVREGEVAYLTVEVVVESEGSLLTGGPVLRPVFSTDGSPWVRSKQSLEEPTGLPSHTTAENASLWHSWRSPPLLEGWEAGVVLLRCYAWVPGKKPALRGWSSVRLKELKKTQPFHLQVACSARVV